MVVRMVERIFATAPNRVVIAGEHGFDWGSKAIYAPVEFSSKRNKVSLATQEGRGKIVLYADEGQLAVLENNTQARGDKHAMLYLESAKAILSKNRLDLERQPYGLSLVMEHCPAPAGTANSASLSAAFCSALYEYLGLIPTTGEFVEAIMASEKQIQSQRAVQPDARTILSDTCLKVRKEFLLDGSTEYNCDSADLSLPSGTCLLYAVSASSSQQPATPQEQETAFASHYGFVRASGKVKEHGALSAAERAKVTEPINRLVERVAAEMKPSGSFEKLASLFGLNHSILSDAGVSSPGIEKMIEVAKGAGALGAKLTGTGGEGGAALIYCKETDSKAVSKALDANKFKAFEISFSTKGANASI